MHCTEQVGYITSVREVKKINGQLGGLASVPVQDNYQSSWGLLDRSMARYFYKRLKTSLHKPRGHLLENLFSNKCVFKNNLQLFRKKAFVSNKYNT
jgi:hypothetical protein